MPPYMRLGSIPRKRHIAHPNRPGFKNEGIYYEEVVTVAGFSRAYSILYHLRPPTRVLKIEPAGSSVIETIDLQPIDPQANGPQLYYGLRYHAHIVKPGEVETYHDQVGYWLWEPATGTVIQTLTIPRGQTALAIGSARADSTSFELVARRGETSNGICSNPFLEDSFQISWEYLERSGELGDGAAASRFLSDVIETMIRRGQRSRLALSNRAIGAYQRFRSSGDAGYGGCGAAGGVLPGGDDDEWKWVAEVPQRAAGAGT